MYGPLATEATMKNRFANRSEAGRTLAAHLTHLAGVPDLQVLALPRGGVPVGFEIAQALDAPLDVMIVRKLGVPWHEELAMGAISTGGIAVLNEDVVSACGITPSELEKVMAKERSEVERREQTYREGRPAAVIRGKTIVLVDDGIATGATMRVAIGAVRQQKPSKLIVAVPVATSSMAKELARLADEVVCPMEVWALYAIGEWYVDFGQVSDDQVLDLLHRARHGVLTQP